MLNIKILPWGGRVLGKLPVPGRPADLDNTHVVGQGPSVFAIGAVGDYFRHFFSRLSFPSSFSLSLGDSPI